MWRSLYPPSSGPGGSFFSLEGIVPHSPADIRNFAIVGHASSGKTILTEAMLLCSDAIGRMGRIADGSTVSDYHVSEDTSLVDAGEYLLGLRC
jgi:hypothetical protein